MPGGALKAGENLSESLWRAVCASPLVSTNRGWDPQSKKANPCDHHLITCFIVRHGVGGRAPTFEVVVKLAPLHSSCTASRTSGEGTTHHASRCSIQPARPWCTCRRCLSDEPLDSVSEINKTPSPMLPYGPATPEAAAPPLGFSLMHCPPEFEPACRCWWRGRLVALLL